MAACTELEIEEKSSDESSRSIVHTNDPTFYNVSSSTRYNPAWNANIEKELDAQLAAESETGDLKELSDDEFLHLLKEASTFNKPNNQESILLKQLRKEVAESDCCENVGRGETGCVSKRVDRKCSKVSCGSACSESVVSAYTSGLENSTATLPARTFSKSSRRDSDQSDGAGHVLLGVCEGQYVKRSQVSHHIVEIESNNNQWCVKPVKLPESSDSSSLPLQTLSNSLDNKRQRKKETSSIYLPNHFICDFDTSNISQTDAIQLDAARKTNADNNESSTMVKLEKEQASILVVSGCNDFVKEQRRMEDNGEGSLPQKQPQEIELIQLRRSKDIDINDENQKNDSSDKRQVSNELSSSKFYVNCNDVDTTVTFPLKLVSSAIDDRNNGGLICDAVSDQFKRQVNFPCFSWPRAQQVHSFLGALPVDHEGLQTQTLVDYPGATLLTEGQSSKLEWNHRKHKRTRNSAENSTFILSENIAGHRGNEDIDSLVKFIEASDKSKVFPRNSTKQIINNNFTPDSAKKKVIVKENKNNQTKNNVTKKKTLLDDNYNVNDSKSSTLGYDAKTYSLESESSDDSASAKGRKTVSVPCESSFPCLDVNCNVMESFPDELPDQKSIDADAGDMLDLSSSARSTSPEASGFAADFYAVAETLPQQVEESGFRIVKKKQRKRHQGKRSENYRWHSAAARVRQSTSGDRDYYSKDEGEHGNSMMLLSNRSQRNQCGKQDSRRKSTSSVPHSEQSSADNSDLDSVHSLPVRGSAPYPTKAHPHTTPSSSSSTPQASYADIARMPVSSMSKQMSSGTMSATNSNAKQSISSEKDPNLMESPSSEKGHDPVIVKSSDGSDSCVITKNGFKLTREINTQTEPLSTDEKIDLVPVSNMRSFNCLGASSERRSSLQCSPNCKNRNCSCTKQTSGKLDSLDRLQRPAVVMMGNIPAMGISDISFGIDINEILEISAGETANLNDSDVISRSSDLESCEPSCQSCDPSDGRDQTAACASSFECHLNYCDASEQANQVSYRKLSSPCRAIALPSGQKLQFQENAVDTQKFNYSQIVKFFCSEWKNVQEEFMSEENEGDEKVMYYNSSC